ncbi:MAG: YcxB family protein [Campylobacteraceae bacterium]
MINLTYFLDENDYLEFQLYTASKSKRVKKMMLFDKLVLPLIYTVIAIAGYVLNLNVIFYLSFVVLAILWFFLYPKYNKFRYKKHYLFSIREHFSKALNEEITLLLDDKFLKTSTKSANSSINTSEIECINEIKNHIFIKLNSGVSIILPKDKIEDISAVINELEKLSQSLNITYNKELDWNW